MELHIVAFLDMLEIPYSGIGPKTMGMTYGEDFFLVFVLLHLFHAIVKINNAFSRLPNRSEFPYQSPSLWRRETHSIPSHINSSTQ